MQYNPPAGMLGAAVASLFGEEPGQQMQEDLRRLKQYLETGEIVDTKGQPRGSESRISEDMKHQDRHVNLASEESFPASDAPAYTG